MSIVRSSKFKRDLKKIIKQHKNLTELAKVVNGLASKRGLPSKYRDHVLVGEWSGYRECHISPDSGSVEEPTKPPKKRCGQL